MADPDPSRPRPPEPSLTMFLLVRALPAWLRLSRAERDRVARAARAHADPKGRVALRLFDAEALSAACTDLWMIEALSLPALHAFTERLRDTPLFAEPFFELREVIPALEDGFGWFEALDAGEADHAA